MPCTKAFGKNITLAFGQDTVVPMLQFTETYDVDQKIAERAYRPDLMEKELKILAQIDRQIAKTIDNLIRAKEYKKFYVREAIEAKAMGRGSLPAKQIPGPAEDLA